MFFLSLLITIFANTIVPLIIVAVFGKRPKKQSLTIAIVNAVVVYIIFVAINTAADAGTTSAFPAYLFGVLSYFILLDKDQKQEKKEDTSSEDTVSVMNEDTEDPETMYIKVSGNSMSPKIEDGDTIQVHKQASVDSGEIAVILLDGEKMLVKKIVYGLDGAVELHSLNPAYPVMKLDSSDGHRVQVLGSVQKITKNV